MMAAQLDRGNYEMLSIIHEPASKIYCLMDDVELEESPVQPKIHPDRLVLRCTRRELATIRYTGQYNLNFEQSDANTTDPV
jgi:hypothetical protein